MRIRPAFACLATLALLALPGTSHAQSPKDAKALKLLKEGTDHLDAGRAVEACKALEQSLKIEAAINTHYQLGRCYEAQSLFATAHAAYLRAATMARTAKDNARFEAAQSAADDIKTKIASFVVVVPPDNELPGLVLTRDGTTIPREDWGKATPIDAGKHTIKAEAPGYEPWSETVDAQRTGGATTVAIPKLKPAGEATTPPTGAEPPAPEPDDSNWERRSSGLFGLGIAMICVGGVGVLGGLGGAVGASGSADVPPGAFIGIAIGGLALLGAGIPITAVFGAKVPPEGEAQPDPASNGDGAPETDEEKPAEESAIYLTPLIGPAWGGLRLDF